MASHEYCEVALLYIALDDGQVAKLQALGLHEDRELALVNGELGKLPAEWLGVETKRHLPFDRVRNEQVPEAFEKTSKNPTSGVPVFCRPLSLPHELHDQFGMVLKNIALLVKPKLGPFAGRNILFCVFRKGWPLEAPSREVLIFFKECISAPYGQVRVLFQPNCRHKPLEFWFDERLKRAAGRGHFIEFDWFGIARIDTH